MRMVKSVLLGAALLALVPSIASAQHRFHVNFGGGPTFIAGGLGERFSTGLGPAVGVTFEVNNRIGIQFEYAFRRFHAENWLDTFGGSFTAYHDTHQLAFDLIFNITPSDSRVRVYAVAGPGAYYRNVTVTEYVGSGIVCDPYWYICGTYPITDVLGTRGGWDAGFNVGAGVGFKLGSSEDAEFTIESRYHWVQGPEFTPTQAQAALGLTGGKATGHYIPLTFGFRF